MPEKEQNVSTSISLRRLAEELGKIGITANADDIVQMPNPSFETPEIVKEYREVASANLTRKKYNDYDPTKPTLNAWTRADILYRMGR